MILLGEPRSSYLIAGRARKPPMDSQAHPGAGCPSGRDARIWRLSSRSARSGSTGASLSSTWRLIGASRRQSAAPTFEGSTRAGCPRPVPELLGATQANRNEAGQAGWRESGEEAAVLLAGARDHQNRDTGPLGDDDGLG